MSQPYSSQSLIRYYYLGTVVFLLLDVVLDINVRIAFLENNPVLRAAYYAAIFACMALVLWRPGWTVIVSAAESLVTLVALILNMGMRVMLGTGVMLESGGGIVTMPEIFNFLITGSIAYLAFTRGMDQLRGE